MIKSESLKKFLPDLAVIVAFILIPVVYFAPAIFEGRTLMQHDTLAAMGKGQEQRDFMARHDGERTRWNLSMFGGMPSYQMSPTYNSSKPTEFARRVYTLFLSPRYITFLFIMLLGFYILMRTLKLAPLISALGAVIWTFSSYFFILIAAGHIWKFYTLAYIPPTIAGIILIYRKKYLLGALLVMIFVSFQIVSNHIQMSYYFAFLKLFLIIGFFADALKNKTLPDFAKATGVLIIATLIGFMANASTLYHTWEYSQQTIRGKSELTHHGDDASGRLERSFITAWSYGIGETWSLLIPNVKGGSSAHAMAESERAMSRARPEYREIFAGIGQYWGEQPMTKGPVYVGAFVLTLFVLGLFVVKGSMKWALLVGTIFSILLSWGHNFMWLTDIFIDHVPLYNKFRTVSSILVVAQFCIPLLAVLALKEIIEKPEILKNNLKYLYISLGVTAGVAFLFAIAPQQFFSSFVSTREMSAFQQGLPSEHLQPFINNLTDMRVAIFTADAWRSFFIIAIGAALLWLFIKQKIKAQWLVAGILVVCLVDMWGVNKRYLHDGLFQTRIDHQRVFTPTPTDQVILDDPTLNFRVLNMNNPFNDGVTPFFHKVIGGYHAAKLRRYQDVIDVHLHREMRALQEEVVAHQGVLDSANYDAFRVLNMLNMRWIIFPIQGGTFPIENPHTQGNAWFVDELIFVDSADEEIAALGEIDLRTQAVTDRRFAPVLGNFRVTPRDSLSTIELISYDSNYMKYSVSAKTDEFAVFSEVYYPHGWRITINGERVNMLRVNYTLRGLPIPAGEHTVLFKFDPYSIRVTDTIAYIALILIAITGVLVILRRFRGVKGLKEV
jgi:hypothetical protein